MEEIEERRDRPIEGEADLSDGETSEEEGGDASGNGRSRAL